MLPDHPRARHRRRLTRRINSWLKQARDGVRLVQDGSADEDSPSVWFERL